MAPAALLLLGITSASAATTKPHVLMVVIDGQLTPITNPLASLRVPERIFAGAE